MQNSVFNIDIYLCNSKSFDKSYGIVHKAKKALVITAGMSDGNAFAGLWRRNANVVIGVNRVDGYSLSVPSQIKELNRMGRAAPTHATSGFKVKLIAQLAE